MSHFIIVLLAVAGTAVVIYLRGLIRQWRNRREILKRLFGGIEHLQCTAVSQERARIQEHGAHHRCLSATLGRRLLNVGIYFRTEQERQPTWLSIQIGHYFLVWRSRKGRAPDVELMRLLEQLDRRARKSGLPGLLPDSDAGPA